MFNTKEELAALLNNRQYGEEIGQDESKRAKELGLIVVFGGSDDLIEFEGFIYDEFGAWAGGKVYIDKKGVLPDKDSIEEDGHLEKYLKRKKTAKEIKAIWAPKNSVYSWIYKTDIPHSEFDILEDESKYCRGIVFSIKDC